MKKPQKRETLITLMIIALMMMCQVGWAQQAIDKTVNLNMRAVKVTQLFNELNKQTGINLVYNTDEVGSLPLITVVEKNTTLRQVLDKVMPKIGCTYQVKGNVVTITKRSNDGKTRKISGTVIDETGEPLIGASITVVDKNKFAATDAEGHFTIEGISANDRLQVSYIGMKTVIVNASDGVITLKSDNTIEEVVVTGIYTRKAESYTGSATTVSGKDLVRVGNQNLFQSLKSLDPSVYIADNLTMGSDPNSVPSMSMRGTSSFPAEASSLKSSYQHQPNEPLFILDGFETTAEHVMDLDMNRIESVTILKDASAKALYGSKAANGVIVIETKRLAGTDTRVTYNGSINLEMPDLTSYDMTNAMEKLQVEMYEGLYSAAQNGGYATSELEAQELYQKRYKKVLEGLSTDWMSKPLHMGVGHKHNLNVEMGDARSLRAVLNFTYNDVQGIMKGSNRRNISGDASISYRKKNLLFKNILSVVSNNSKDSPYGTFSDYVIMNPYWEAEDENGKVLRWAENSKQNAEYATASSIPNPMYDAYIGTSLKSSYSEIVDNFYTEWTISPDWKAIIRLGAEHKRNDADSYYPAMHSRFASYFPSQKARRGLYIMENGKQTQLSGDLNINYNHSFGEHHLFGNAGYFVSETKYQAYQHQAEGFANNTAADATFARSYAEGTTPTGYGSVNREMSFLGALSYDYGNRYLLDATVRESASSLYGADKRWANSWSFGLGWNVHNEPFLKNAAWLQQFKIRSSIGLTGNQNFSTNEAIATYRYFAGVIYEGQMGAYLNTMPNSLLMWEQKKDYNLGFDLKAFGLSLSFDIYRADTKNMLTNVTIPTSTGFSSVKDNLGLVRNSGVEIKANYTPFSSKNGFLSVYGSFVYTKNKIITLSESMREYNARMMALAAENTQSAPVLMYQDGLSMNTIWAVPSAGIDPQSGNELYIKKDGTLTYAYDSSDMIAAGDATPKYRGNAGFTAEYKGFGLTATLTYLAGGQMYNSTLVSRVEDADIRYNVDRRVLTGRWQTPGQVTQYKRYNANSVTRATTRFVQDRNELSLSSISAYYEFPKSIYSKLYMQRLRFAAYLNDVATFSSIKVERGTSYPFARTLSFSLSATF
ncbi:MAG: SusC/RagA family TonB-linked outer membrane protein [Prevotella sp.]|nr:SusC/RagA family TonB-linked outer membrane protein [Prevotella sp.]